MKLFTLTLVLAVTALTNLSAQSIGGRYSNYETELESGLLSLDTGRSSSIGIIGDYRSGSFILDWRYEHDFEAGINLVEFIPLDVANYERDRGEFGVGLAPTRNVAVLAGVRIESFAIDAPFFDDNDFFSNDDIEHEAIFVGANFRSSTNRPAGFMASARVYLGSAEVDSFTAANLETDTIGYKFEFGVPIAVGSTQWEVTPGLEFERLEMDDLDFDITSNRLFINFAYRFDL